MNKSKLSKAFFFKFSERLLVKFVGLVIGVVLARLLEPDIFGQLAIITVFINLANVFTLSGLGTALVQNRTADHKDYSTVYYITLAIALVLIAIIFLLAPYIAAIYNAPELIVPLRVMALSLITASFNAVQNAKLQRELRFREMMYCNLAATVIAGAVGVSVAIIRPSIWALVVYQCGCSVLLSVIMLPICGWRPKWEFGVLRAKEFFAFGSRVMASSLLCSLYTDIRALIIGRKYTTADLAHYSKAQQYPDTVAYTFDSSISSVLISALSALQASVQDMWSLLLKTVKVSLFFAVPMLLGFAAVSESFVLLLLTEKWDSCIPLMRVFCFSNIAMPIGTASLCYIKACGRGSLFLRSEIIKRAIMIAILLITVFCFNSVMAIAIGAMLCAWVDVVVVIYAAKVCGGPGILEYCRQTWKTYLSGFIMFAIIALMNSIVCPMLIKLILQIFAGVCVYVGVSLLLKNEAALDIYRKIVLGLRKR